MRKYGTGKRKMLVLRKTGDPVCGWPVSGINMMTTEFPFLTSYYNTKMINNTIFKKTPLDENTYALVRSWILGGSYIPS